MDVAQVLSELQSLGTEQTRKTYRRHGADEEMFGVKVGDLKKVLKKIKGNQSLAMELWDTGNSDAMYLAAMVADGGQMKASQLNAWAKSASWYMLSEYALPSVAAQHPAAFDLAKKWIRSKQPAIAAGGWTTYSLAMATRPDAELDLAEIRELLKKVEAEIESAAGRVRYGMNGFVISVGAYVKPLLKSAKATAKRIGTVDVDMGETACQVPLATAAIEKIESMGRVGLKRKSTKC